MTTLLSQIEKEIYIAGWFSEMKIIRLFLCPDILKINRKYPITGRKGDEIYAIYRTGSRAGSETDGLADVPEELRAF